MALSPEITKTLELFSQMMIEKIETISTDWQNPGLLKIPCSSHGILQEESITG